MSVFTTVEPAQLENFLKRYALGKACNFSPIPAGITNTNYYLDTDRGSYVLTLYEHHSDDELDYILGLQQHLAAKALRCPAPVKDRRGDFYSSLNQRPAAIIQRLPGKVETALDQGHCAQLGAELAGFHLAGQDYVKLRPNPRGVEWLLAAGDMLEAELSLPDRQLLMSTIADFREFNHRPLAHGAIHADLFHDNALFLDDELGGIIDFDYACHDSLVLDIAVVMNDWCLDVKGDLEPERAAAVLNAYQQRRHLDRQEIRALPLMLRFSALRFWLSRLYDKVFPQGGELTFAKNPDWFRELLVKRTADENRLRQWFQSHFGN